MGKISSFYDGILGNNISGTEIFFLVINRGGYFTLPSTGNDTQRNTYELYRLQLCSQVNVRGSRKGRVVCKKK